MVRYFVDENRYAKKEILANSIVGIYQTINTLQDILLPMFKYLNRFYAMYNQLEKLEDVIAMVIRERFLRPLLLEYYVDNPQHPLIHQMDGGDIDLLTILTRFIGNLCAEMQMDVMPLTPSISQANAVNEKVSLTILSSHADAVLINAQHPLCHISSVLSDLLTSPSDNTDGATHCAIYISNWDNRIVQFAEYYQSDPMFEIEKPLKSTSMSDIVQEYYSNFIDSLTVNELCDMTLVSNTLEIASLLDLGSAKSCCYDER